jgi:hypothetical protein
MKGDSMNAIHCLQNNKNTEKRADLKIFDFLLPTTVDQNLFVFDYFLAIYTGRPHRYAHGYVFMYSVHCCWPIPIKPGIHDKFD